MTTDEIRTELRSFEGRTLDGRYRLSEWIGGGAFGGVFRSEQLILGRPVRSVACKLSMASGMSERDARELFTDVLTLAEAMDGLADTEARRHLVHVYDGGLARDAGGRAFLVMEYVKGPTLATEFARHERVPAGLLFGWARQICVALRGLHLLEKPLLHRDLKPDNVLLGLDRTVRLIDFGLAARVLAAGHVPGVAGTLRYMAPETSLGRSVPGSDLYSLGVLVYEGLTGRHPFHDLLPPPGLPDALHGEWLYERKKTIAPVPPSRLNNTVSPAADALVLRCLALEPARRFHSATELLEAITRLDSEPRQAPPGERALEAARKRTAEDRPGAIRVLSDCLDTEDPAPALRLAILRELACLLEAEGDLAGAARRLAAAWQLVEHRALLRTRDERCALLARTADAYRRAGNAYQATDFEQRLRRERRGG